MLGCTDMRLCDRRLCPKRVSPTLFMTYSLRRFSFIFLALPLQAILFDKASPRLILYTYAVELCLILPIAAVSWERYLSLGITLRGTCVSIVHGLLFKSTDHFYASRHTGFTIRKKPYYLPRGDVKLTAVSGRLKSDIYLTGDFSKELTAQIRDRLHPDAGDHATVRSDTLSTLLVSATLSGSLTGTLYAVPFLRSAARLLGEERLQSVLLPLGQGAGSVFSILPPVLRLVSGIMLILWAAGTTVRFFLLSGLRLTKEGELLTLRRGLLSTRLFVAPSGVSALITRRSPLSLITGLCCCEALLPTDERFSTEPVFIGRYKGHEHRLLQRLLHNTADEPSAEFRPEGGGVFGYLYLPLSAISVLSLGSILLDACSVRLLPKVLPMLLLFPLTAWYFFRLYAYKMSSIRIFSSHISVTTFGGFTLKEVTVAKNDIRAVITTQSIPARHRGRCDLKLLLSANKHCKLKIKQISPEVTTHLCI